MQLAIYRYVLTRKIKYHLYVLINFIYYPIFLMLFFVTSILFYEFYCSAPAAWMKVLSFSVCFKSVASFCHPQYLLRTSPRSIPCAWNSRIWHFHLNNTLLPRRNVWNLIFATLRPESMKLTCQFRRFLARTFRPVDQTTCFGKCEIKLELWYLSIGVQVQIIPKSLILEWISEWNQFSVLLRQLEFCVRCVKYYKKYRSTTVEVEVQLFTLNCKNSDKTKCRGSTMAGQ